eukprot:1152389-Pelagomonas_calceolata.AAC.3
MNVWAHVMHTHSTNVPVSSVCRTRSSELSLASWRDPIGPCEDERAHTSYHGSVQDFSLDARV